MLRHKQVFKCGRSIVLMKWSYKHRMYLFLYRQAILNAFYRFQTFLDNIAFVLRLQTGVHLNSVIKFVLLFQLLACA